MHEYSLMERVIENITEQLRTQNSSKTERVREIDLTVGALDLHSTESFEQAFKMLTAGTVLQGAALKLIIEPATVECKECGFKGSVNVGEVDGHDPTPAQACPECGRVNYVKGGRGVSHIELELEQLGESKRIVSG